MLGWALTCSKSSNRLMHALNGNGTPDSQHTLVMDPLGDKCFEDSSLEDTQPALHPFVSAPDPEDPIAEYTQ
eukprot:9735609-Alexandrium_andersonii.AAC.1